jgi:Tfp pilus assembly protein PilN
LLLWSRKQILTYHEQKTAIDLQMFASLEQKIAPDLQMFASLEQKIAPDLQMFASLEQKIAPDLQMFTSLEEKSSRLTFASLEQIIMFTPARDFLLETPWRIIIPNQLSTVIPFIRIGDCRADQDE